MPAIRKRQFARQSVDDVEHGRLAEQFAPRVQVGLLYHPDRARDPTVRWFIDFTPGLLRNREAGTGPA